MSVVCVMNVYYGCSAGVVVVRAWSIVVVWLWCSVNVV